MDAHSGEGVIRFQNLRQYTDTVGEYTEVKAKAVPFVSSNAKGILRSVESLGDIARIAKADAAQIRSWTGSTKA